MKTRKTGTKQKIKQVSGSVAERKLGSRGQLRDAQQRNKASREDLVSSGQRQVEFPQVQGKTTKRVVLLTSSEYHHISMEFQDETALHFAIEPGFTIKAGYEYVEKDKLCAKQLPAIRSYRESD